VSQLLNKDDKLRVTASKALDHAWFDAHKVASADIQVQLRPPLSLNPTLALTFASSLPVSTPPLPVVASRARARVRALSLPPLPPLPLPPSLCLSLPPKQFFPRLISRSLSLCSFFRSVSLTVALSLSRSCACSLSFSLSISLSTYIHIHTHTHIVSIYIHIQI